MKTTLREHIEQLIKDYTSLILKYKNRSEDAKHNNFWSAVAVYEEKIKDYKSVIVDLKESLR